MLTYFSIILKKIDNSSGKVDLFAPKKRKKCEFIAAKELKG